MHILLISLASVLIMLGVDCLIKELIKTKFKKNPDIFIYRYKNENDIEYIIRRIQQEHPDSEIYIVKNSGDISPVSEKLSEDFSNIHIVNSEKI